MSRMTTRTLSAILALVIPALAGAQTTGEEEYFDPVVYQVEDKYPVVSYPSGYVLDNSYPWEASIPFDPRHAYTAEEKQAILDEEVALTGGRLTTEADGSPAIEIAQPEIPEASRDTSAPPEESYEEDGAIPLPQLGAGVSPTSTPASMTRHASYGKGYGNNLFGSHYFIDTYVHATEATATEAKKLSAYVESTVSGTAFNTTKQVARARMDAAGQAGGTTGGTAKLYAMGQLIYSKNLSGTFSLTPVNLSRSFFKVHKWFMVGPVPVKVTASLAGGVKLSLSGTISTTQTKLNSVPGAYVNVSASAGVDILIFGFGVSGSLNLINVSTPALAELVWPSCSGLTWRLAASRNLSTLSGTIKLYAKVWFIFFVKTWHLTIANWPGIVHNTALFDYSGSAAMGICPGFTPAVAPLASMASLQ